MRMLYIVSGSVMILAWVIPDHYLPWRAFYNEFFSFLAFLFLWGSQIANRKYISCFVFVGIIVLAFIFIQYGLGIYFFRSDAVMAGIYIGSALLAYQLGLSLKRNSEIFWLAVVLAVGGGINALIGIAQWLQVESFWTIPQSGGRSEGNLGQANNYATLLVWALVANIYLFLNRATSFAFFLFLGFLLIAGILVSESRTPIVQLCFVFVWLFWGCRGFVSIDERIKASVPIVIYGVAYLFYPMLDAVWNFSDPEGVRLVTGSYGKRVAIWLSLAPAVLNSPPLGYGVGQVSVAQFSYLNEFAETVEMVEHSHNLIIDMVVWFGPVLGGGLALFILIWIARRYFQRISGNEWFLLAIIAVVLIHSMLEYPIEYAYFLLPVAFVLGLADRNKVKLAEIAVGRFFYSGTLLVLMIVGAGVIWREYRVLEEDHRLMRGQNFGLPIDGKINLSQSVAVIDGEREYIQFARKKAHADMSETDLLWMKMVVYRYPFPVLIYRYSVALALNNREAEGYLELQKIKHLYGETLYEYYKYFMEGSVAAGREV
ncbi:hypothetical protein DWB84_03015 [Saccharophagus sp. K07]|uniref:PglL family O-oligosaccharyltransferase n=1 Tax=Saccharophagus sp. K07 TaxID=2283636 RepID=UPI00165254C2|nr:O-antigen ligase family protein [Saccharophagus sp. K07]MBC6904437.1 hypothetical protein [Saccharophagus sp. K07]